MAIRHYIEKFQSWQNPSASTDNQWLEFDLSTFNIPPNAVVEIAISNSHNSAEFWGGVRATSGSLNRRIQIVKSLDGDSFCTMHVQADTNSKIDYFSQLASAINFTVVGYWVGCEYVEAFRTIALTGSASWQGLSLVSDGVAEGQVAEFVMANISSTLPNEVGVRASGSLVSRLFDVSDAAGFGKNCLSKLVIASGINASVETYAENVGNVNAFFLGYFETPPGDYIESNILFPNPTIDAAWNELDVGSSGIPNNAVAEFIMGQDHTVNQDIGIRSTSSSLSRIMNLEESEDNAGLSWTKMPVKLDTSGFIQYYVNETSVSDPDFVLSSYWTNFSNSSTPFTHIKKADLFINGRNPFVHYTEGNGINGISLNVSASGVWETHNLSVFNVPKSTNTENIVAEIGISNSDNIISYECGARSNESSQERRFRLHSAKNGALDILGLLVPVDSNGNISIYADHTSSVDFHVIGYWRGATYVDEHSVFQASSSGTWTNHDLGPLYANKVVEVVLTNADNIVASGGVRTAGSTINRLHTITQASTGKDHATTHVNASGTNGSIELYSSSVSGMTFAVVGYWESAPGTYNESFTKLTNPSINNVWSSINVGVPNGSVAEIMSENRYAFGSRTMGVRSIGSSKDTRHWNLRRIQSSVFDVAGDMFRSSVTVTSGTNVELLRSSSAGSYAFRLIGHWDNLNNIPVSQSASLFISGPPPSATVKQIDWLIEAHDHHPQIIGTFNINAISVNIKLWDVTGGSGTFVSISNSGCYSIGNTARWGWSTEYIPSSKNNAKHYFYTMISDVFETFDGQFVLDIPEGAKWIYPNDQNDYTKKI